MDESGFATFLFFLCMKLSCWDPSLVEATLRKKASLHQPCARDWACVHACAYSANFHVAKQCCTSDMTIFFSAFSFTCSFKVQINWRDLARDRLYFNVLTNLKQRQEAKAQMHTQQTDNEMSTRICVSSVAGNQMFPRREGLCFSKAKRPMSTNDLVHSKYFRVDFSLQFLWMGTFLHFHGFNMFPSQPHFSQCDWGGGTSAEMPVRWE